MHSPVRLLLCTADPETQLSLQGFAGNHPDVTGFRLVESWPDAAAIGTRYEMIFVDTHLIPSPAELEKVSPHVSVILLASDPNDCRRFRRSPVRGCLITPVSFEAFQWTIRSMQPMYAAELA